MLSSLFAHSSIYLGLESFRVCAAENKREAAPVDQQLLRAFPTALTNARGPQTIWEIHLLPATAQSWRKKLIALDNKTPQSLPYSHRKSGLKINTCFTSFCFLTFFILEPNTEMNLRYNLFMWLQHDHPTQTQTQTSLSLDLQLPEVGREGTRSHKPGALQESATPSVFPRHRLLSPPAPMEKRGLVPQAVS